MEGATSEIRVRTYLGLGANLGNAPHTLARAVQALDALPESRLVGVSRLYATRPVGVLDQPDFHNAVVGLDVLTPGDAEARALTLLIALKALERSFGRQLRTRWGPRELDLDLLIFGRHRFRRERPADGRSADTARTGVQWLEVPHPAAAERTFVLAPLADLVPGLVPPGWRVEVGTALQAAREAEGLDAVRAVARWGPANAGWVAL
jgi:2-amino-4-hydroxy-6-hydroxymethyldihydropteridine diphosphokinase